jgi:hypothetical protein
MRTFTGPMPELKGLTQLRFVDVSNNALEGPLPSLQGLPNLSDFVASSNNLSGSLSELAELPALGYVLLDHNEFDGPLPDLSGLASINTVRIDHNALSGPIPPAPAALFPGVSSLCPNLFDTSPGPNDAGWDAATGITPWYTDCESTADRIFTDGFDGSQHSRELFRQLANVPRSDS